MELSFALQEKLISFLTSLPNIHDSDSQRAFIYQAGFDSELQEQIQFGKSPVQFISLLLSTLVKYGKLKDGRQSVRAILETAKNYVGYDKKAYCDMLLKEIDANMVEETIMDSYHENNNSLQNRHYRYNVVFVGKTGIGKSSLINYLYGYNVFKTGVGKPVTKNGFHPIDLEINGLCVRLFDSWGLEIGKEKKWMQELQSELERRGTDKPMEEWFHSVFYCIAANNHRIEDFDLDIIKTFIQNKYKKLF